MNFILNNILYFIIYGFGGCLLESSYATVMAGFLSKRCGFLTNYFCPLYGLCGVYIVNIYKIFLEKFSSTVIAIILSIICSAIVVTALEYIAGFLLDNIFNYKMWDYGSHRFNVSGYICLDFTIIWGLLSVVVAFVIHPVVNSFIVSISPYNKLLIIALVASYLLVDMTITINQRYISFN